ncbi:MAG: FadR/GntR family transcriptional regulator, partial [Smithellaceae bacterium]|nr:FadR/GntR family transcriptional regulator [Smithellaceae bacterium]
VMQTSPIAQGGKGAFIPMVQKSFATPVTRSRLHEEIVTVIQKQIMSGQINAGDKLPTERELSENFQVNRATVREALRKLENLGLLEIRHGDGLYAKNYLESGNFDLIKAAFNMDGGQEVMMNILEARRYLVPQMAYLAAQRRTTKDLEDLKRVVDDPEMSMLEKDIQVHQVIARSTQNLLCTIGLNFFNQIFRDYGYLYFDSPKNIERSRKFHSEIYEAVKNKEAEPARKIMREVLVYAEKAVLASMKSNKL